MRSKIKTSIVFVGMLPLYLIQEVIHIYGYHYVNPYGLPYGIDPLKQNLSLFIRDLKS
jgi:hypothetical protein